MWPSLLTLKCLLSVASHPSPSLAHVLAALLRCWLPRGKCAKMAEAEDKLLRERPFRYVRDSECCNGCTPACPLAQLVLLTYSVLCTRSLKQVLWSMWKGNLCFMFMKSSYYVAVLLVHLHLYTWCCRGSFLRQHMNRSQLYEENTQQEE